MFPKILSSLRLLRGRREVCNYGDNLPSIDNVTNSTVYSLPFRGEWVVVNGCYTQQYSHSWGLPSQRYAYDFIMLDSNAQSYDGPFKACESYYCYNQEILAPADGEVVELLDGCEDSLILGKIGYFVKAKHIAGNYIVIKHNSDEYSFLAHLKKGSLRVVVGDVVIRGQVIAHCGNTGNSSEPHLHYQLQRGKDFYSSPGIPIQFDAIKVMEIPNYKTYDPREHMELSELRRGYLSRGFAVKNE